MILIIILTLALTLESLYCTFISLWKAGRVLVNMEWMILIHGE